jgi:hypothetical protein
MSRLKLELQTRTNGSNNLLRVSALVASLPVMQHRVAEDVRTSTSMPDGKTICQEACPRKPLFFGSHERHPSAASAPARKTIRGAGPTAPAP